MALRCRPLSVSNRSVQLSCGVWRLPPKSCTLPGTHTHTHTRVGSCCFLFHVVPAPTKPVRLRHVRVPGCNPTAQSNYRRDAGRRRRFVRQCGRVLQQGVHGWQVLWRQRSSRRLHAVQVTRKPFDLWRHSFRSMYTFVASALRSYLAACAVPMTLLMSRSYLALPPVYQHGNAPSHMLAIAGLHIACVLLHPSNSALP